MLERIKKGLEEKAIRIAGENFDHGCRLGFFHEVEIPEE